MSEQYQRPLGAYSETVSLITAEHTKAINKFPNWPVNPYEGYTVLAEEVGELAKALLDYEHKGASIDDAITEAAQSGAMCIRVLQHLLYLKEQKAND